MRTTGNRKMKMKIAIYLQLVRESTGGDKIINFNLSK